MNLNLKRKRLILMIYWGESLREAERVREISTSMIRKMFEIVAKAKKEGIDVVSLSIGEPDFDTDERIIDFACKAKKMGYTHYTSNLGLDELREAIADRYHVDKDEVMVTAGGSEGLINASLSFIDRGSEVIIPTPNFLSYFIYTKLCEAKTIQIRTHPEFKLDINKISESASKKTSAIFLNYPNNPTGKVETKKNLEAVLEIAEDCGAIVISDEIYDQIYYEKKPVNLVDYENVVVVNGFSKSLAMTGWRIGFVIARKDLINTMLKVHQVNGVCAPAFAQKAVAEAFACGIFDEFTSKIRNAFRERRDYIYRELKKLGFKAVKPEGAFYIFPEIPEYFENCNEFVEKLVMNGVALTPGTPFGDGNERYVRISYACSIESLKKAVERIKIFLDSQS